MNAPTSLPLNEPQQRRLTVALAVLERHLATIRLHLLRAPETLRLTCYTDPLHPKEARVLRPAIAATEQHLRAMADALDLAPVPDSVRRSLGVRLDLAAIHLSECRPSAGLQGCGAVAPTTSDYLERELPRLEESVRRLAQLLARADSRAGELVCSMPPSS